MKKVTLVLEDEDLYEALKLFAARDGRTLRQVISEALEQWVEAKEDAEDAAFAREAKKEQGKNISWEQVKSEMHDYYSFS